MLTMLELMRLTCCVLPQGKALNVCVKLRMKCIVYRTFIVTLMLINLRMHFQQIAFVLKRIVPTTTTTLFVPSVLQ